jgi:hypothetical protein
MAGGLEKNLGRLAVKNTYLVYRRRLPILPRPLLTPPNQSRDGSY